MVITFSVILLGLLALIKPLQRNAFYILHAALVILSAYYVENHYFRTTPFVPKTFLLFLVFHLVSINITTMIAYWSDKRAAVKGRWRVSENNLHTLEFLGGWPGAFIAQKIFKHKTKKKTYQAAFWLMLILQAAAVYIILKFLRII